MQDTIIADDDGVRLVSKFNGRVSDATFTVKTPTCPYPAASAEAALWQRRAECEWALPGLASFVAMHQRSIEDAMAKKAQSEAEVVQCEAEIAAIDVALAKLAAGAWWTSPSAPTTAARAVAIA